MNASIKPIFGFALLGLSLGSCSVFRSDVNSSNPLIAQQAQRVKELENQLDTQESVVASEKAKQKALEYQIKSAKQELKSRKQQVKVGY